jgi:uncharacterized membrane protein
MRRRSHFLAHSAIIAALYAVLCHFQNLLLPGSASWAIQCRLSEALCVLALFTPAAIPGLTIGCLINNLGSPFGLVDILLGTLATLLATITIRLVATKIKSLTLPISIFSPTLFNSLIVGLEISCINNNLSMFFITAFQVAVGEITVCALLGVPLYLAINKSKLNRLL